MPVWLQSNFSQFGRNGNTGIKEFKNNKKVTSSGAQSDARNYYESNIKPTEPLEFFTISKQQKNGNIANFVLAMPYKIKKTNKVCNLKR